MNPASEDIVGILESESVGTAGTDIFIGREPTSPDSCLTVYDIPGDTPNPKFLLDIPFIQIRSRSNTYTSAYNKIQLAKDKLLGRPSETVNGTLYTGFWVESDIMSIGRDQSERALLTMNMRLSREPAAGDHRAPL